MILCWVDNLDVTVLSSNNSLMNCLISPKNSKEQWMFAGVYASCSYARKQNFWNDLKDIQAFFDGPWFLISDFNSYSCQEINWEVDPFLC